MKKGLLSLLAVALTIVSCQDYDDQFAELTGLVNDLSTEVEGLTQVQTQLTALSTTVSGLSSAIAAIPTTDSTAALAGLTTDLEAAQTAIDAITALLADVADADDLAAVDAAIAALQEDVNTLLEADAVINQNITINNSATLEYVSTLIAHAADDPNVIVNGSVTIETEDLTDAELVTANEIAAKLATVLGTAADEGVEVTSDSAITFTNLSFIDADYVVIGTDMDDAALRTVTGDLILDYGDTAIALNYSQLASVGGDVLIEASTANTVTSVDFSNVDIEGDMIEFVGGTLSAAGVLDFDNALTIDLGSADFISLDAPKANSITSDAEGFASGLTITAGNGGDIDINEATSATNIAITGTSTTVLHMDDLASATDLDINTVGEAHFPALTAFTAASDIEASVATALTSLATITATLDLNTVPAAILTALADVNADLTWDVGVINIPNAAITGGDLLSTTATDVTVKSIPAITDLRGGTGVTKLALTGQDVDLGATGDVTDLTVTADGSGIDFTSAGAALVNVSLSGTEVNQFAATLVALKNITLNDTSTNTLLDDASAVATQTVNLTGTIVAFTSTAAGLEAFNNTATFLDVAPPDATPITIDISGSGLEAVDLSSMEKVAVARFVNNSSLTSLIAPTGATNLLTPGGSPTITITGNSITATYTNADEAFAGDGINPATPYAAACIYSPSLATWKDYITAVTAVDTVTYTIDAIFAGTADGYGEAIVADTEQTHHDGTAGGGANGDTINNAEVGLVLISATACD